MGGVPVHVTCPQNSGFRLRPEALAAAITPRTKWLVLNFPNNPTGAVASRADLPAIAEVLLRHPHVWVMCDDMYEHLHYADGRHVTLAEVAPALRDRTLTVSGVSKTYAMTGWRIGFAGGPRDLIRGMVAMQGHIAAGVSTIGQAAAAAALDGPQELVAGRAAIYRRRRDVVVDALNACPGLSCHRPEGAFYVFPNIAGCIGKTTEAGRVLHTDEDFALALLEEAPRRTCARRGVRHEPLCADQLRDRRRLPRRRNGTHPRVLPRIALTAPAHDIVSRGTNRPHCPTGLYGSPYASRTAPPPPVWRATWQATKRRPGFCWPTASTRGWWCRWNTASSAPSPASIP